MRKNVRAGLLTLWAIPGFARHDMTPLRAAVTGGHSHVPGGATFRLVGVRSGAPKPALSCSGYIAEAS